MLFSLKQEAPASIGGGTFTLLEKGSACGKIQVSTNITKCKQCILINQSPTGVFEQEVDLMKL